RRAEADPRCPTRQRPAAIRVPRAACSSSEQWLDRKHASRMSSVRYRSPRLRAAPQLCYGECACPNSSQPPLDLSRKWTRTITPPRLSTLFAPLPGHNLVEYKKDMQGVIGNPHPGRFRHPTLRFALTDKDASRRRYSGACACQLEE